MSATDTTRGLEPVPVEYRPKGSTVAAFSYSGTFPLDFLRGDETVRRAAPGSRSIIVSQGNREVQVNHGDYLVRDLTSGVLRKESATGWFRRWGLVES